MAGREQWLGARDRAELEAMIAAGTIEASPIGLTVLVRFVHAAAIAVIRAGAPDVICAHTRGASIPGVVTRGACVNRRFAMLWMGVGTVWKKA
jgi:hypothetical protein